MVCAPGITTAAIFTAILLIDLYTREWRRIPGHALFGVFAVILMLFLCERTSEGVAWVLLAAPIAFSLLGWLIHYIVNIFIIRPGTPKSRTPKSEPEDSECDCCGYSRCRCDRPCRQPHAHSERPIPEPAPAVDPSPSVCPEPSKPIPDGCIKPSLAN